MRQAVAPSWGLMPKQACKLYVSVAIPRILYAVDIWGTPKLVETLEAHKKGIGKAITKLTSMQRAGVLAIMGGLRTLPTDALDAHAFLLPIHLEINKQCHRAATWITTLPPDHPHFKPARRCANRVIK